VRAVRAGDVAAVTRALESGTDPDTVFNDQSSRLATPLLVIAAEAGHADVARVLLEHGASVDLPERNTLFHAPQGTALQAAASHGHMKLAESLLAAGADVNAHGGAAIVAAAQSDRVELVELLAKAGADLDVVNEHGESVLDIARGCGAARVLRLLKRLGAPRGPETSAGRRILREQEALKSLRRRWRTATMAPVPRLQRAGRSPAFQATVEWLKQATGQTPVPCERLPGAAEVRLNRAQADELSLTNQAKLRQGGALLVRLAQCSLGNEAAPLRVALVPTPDKYRAIAALFPGAPNYDVGSQDVIRVLKAVEKLAPFNLLMVTHDAIEIRFRGRIDDPERVGRMLYAACPDLVDQGTLTFDRLLTALRRPDPTIFLWWD
jgi:hypothetical protein